MDDPIDPKITVDLFDQGGPATPQRDQPVPPAVPSQSDSPEGRPGRRLTSNMLLGARGVPDPTPPPRPEFDVVTNGLDAEQVQRYLEVLLNWGQRQVHRAEGAEQTLAQAVSELRDAAAKAPGSRWVGTGSDGATTADQPDPPGPVSRPDSAGKPAAKPAPKPTPGTGVPRPRTNGHVTPPSRPDERPRVPPLSRRSPPPPPRPPATVSRLDDTLVASALSGLLGGSRWDHFRGRRSQWSAFHLRSLTAGSRQVRHTIAAGPPGLFSLSTPYHRGAEIVVDGCRVLVDGQECADAARMVTEADQAGELLGAMLSPSQVIVRPVLAFVGVRSVRIERPGRLVVTTTANLAAYLRALPDRLAATDLDAIGALGRHTRPGMA